MFLVVSTSLSSSSRSRKVARRALDLLEQMTDSTPALSSVPLLDLADYALPLHDGTYDPNDSQVNEVKATIGAASGIVLVAPVYHGEVAISARNLILLTGNAWKRKVVGIVGVAGGADQFQSVLGMVNTLMWQQRTFVVPDFVFMTSHALTDDPAEIQEDEDLRRMLRTVIRVTEALSTA